MSSSRNFIGAAGVAACLVSVACSSKAMPGTPLGTFNVTGTLTTNTCGAGQNAPNPWTFQVDLSLDGSTLYWSWRDGSAYLTGALVSGVASLQNSQQATDAVDAASCTAANGEYGYWFGPQQTAAQCAQVAGCTMTRSDTYSLTMASAMKAFTGTVTYAFAASSGSNCSSDLSSAGGTYDSIPCTIEYSLSASQ